MKNAPWPTAFLEGFAAGRRTGSAGVTGLGNPRIVIVLPALGAGGSELVVNFLANRWAGKGWRVTVLTLDRAENGSYYGYHKDVEIAHLALPPEQRAMPAATWHALRRVAALRRRLRDLAPDVVISFLSRTNIMALLASRGLGVPVVVSERNNPERQSIGAVWSMLRAVMYPSAFGLVTMTAGARDFFSPSQRRRSWIIPNFAAPHVGAGAGASVGEGRTIVAAGRLVEQKGFDLLIDAFGRIAGRFPDWTLKIWGEGCDRAALEEQCRRLGLQDRVVMPGTSPSHGSWIAGSEVFVLSSRFEGWGIVLLEAMAAGLPVISFDCQWGPAEMLSDDVDGLMVPREDVAGLADAMARMMGDAGLRQRLGAAARHSAERFRPEPVGQAWDAVVQQAVASGS